MQGYRTLRIQVLSNLEANLPKTLTYHGLDHTMDVLNVCNQYIRREKLPKEERDLLRTGAIVHDMGFLKGSANHEEVGAGMAEVILQKIGVNHDKIETVKGLVLATKIPQTPQNHLQRILCDADLDYLGREDYPEISKKLFEELKTMNVISTAQQWKELQINFLKAHRYHTPFAIKNREPKKQIWLKKLLAS
ncbi:putative metal-dependent HD superfamily phosphohydrolase [Algoriphagus ratkowskyi]|uniref:HD domain-containing protein n=1 Tax=Algoriphagus ratkowskyi TaxID=57028 RepID=A0A2W7RGG3_9BACT|nr:HD domain-containing protein [Algoriphagus ratkowskyi]PZX54647.1 putative metal-dependent HD superfamily phosphohydrolase [Algoriphagus ratkowskyi]TXD76958.1 HD domain-containing protein [Algoriphagus ratkowskyi]